MRPESTSKPSVKDFEEKGAKVHVVDVEKASAEELAKHFEGIDTVISCLLTIPMTTQNVAVDAAAIAKVKRFVPSEWATAYTKGTISIIGDQVSGTHSDLRFQNR